MILDKKTRILFLLSGNLSTTPRALKAILSAQKVCSVDILATSRGKAWDALDQSLVSKYGLNYRSVSLGRKSFCVWMAVMFIQTLARGVSCYLSDSIRLNAYSSEKASILLCLQFPLLGRQKYDFVEGHGYGALYAAFAFATSRDIPFALDIEDYHPGENIACSDTREKSRRTHLLKQLLPQACFFTYAAPLIGKSVLSLFDDSIVLPQHFLVNNCFPANEFIFPLSKTYSTPLRLVWFSQTISYGRGLEEILPAIKELQNDVLLTLIGRIDRAFYQDVLANYSDIIELKTVLPQDDLHKELANYDVGLALEQCGTDENRGLVLTNKIFAYIQAGLYIVATDTAAQKAFLEENLCVGIVCGQDCRSINAVLKEVALQKTEIRRNSGGRYEKAKLLSWELAEMRMVKAWKSI
jgi:glycosyltransferase involved in cell wall biosynthesis